MDEPKDVVIQIRVGKGWNRRAEEAARRKSLPLSTYIRLVVTERMDDDEIPEPEPEPKKPRSK